MRHKRTRTCCWLLWLHPCFIFQNKSYIIPQHEINKPWILINTLFYSPTEHLFYTNKVHDRSFILLTLSKWSTIFGIHFEHVTFLELVLPQSATAVAVKVIWPHVRPSLGQLKGIFFKLCTNVQLSLRMNWLHLRCQVLNLLDLTFIPCLCIPFLMTPLTYTPRRTEYILDI